MFRHCIFCQTDLGTNAAIEAFPIGSRLAFDSARGRLWVVCRRCERWNLTPLDERWDAVEECERRFRGTTLRLSTSNIGLARIPPGLDLIRIGSPLRPELAAWRYGDQFGRRRRRHLALTGAGILLIPAAYFSLTAALGLTGLGGATYQVGSALRSLYRRKRVLRTATLADGQKVPLTPHLVSGATLRYQSGTRWTLNLPSPGWGPDPPRELEGEDALAVARVLLPLVNRAGAGQAAVAQAVRQLDLAPDLEYWMAKTAGTPTPSWSGGRDYEIAKHPLSTRLALEMLLHEDLEQRSLEGELWRLERAWKAAEEIAAIADQLLLPDEIEAQARALRTRPDG